MEYTSNSGILRHIINDESCELKQMIDSFMYEKLAEFQQQVKTNVDKVVTERISAFYNQPWNELDEMVFDDNCANSIIEKVIEYFKPSNVQWAGCEKVALPRYNKILELRGQKCFAQINVGHGIPSGYDMATYFSRYIFKHSYITVTHPSRGNPQYEFKTHTIPTQVLLPIKISCGGVFDKSDNGMPATTNKIRLGFENLQRQYKETPHVFKPNCIEFEQICQREYAEIKKQKEEFEELTEEAHKILDENVEKKEYYASIDARLEQLVIDEEKIKEEKQKLFIVKERLLEMKEELERERQEFEVEKQKLREQRNKSIDIDKCFEDLL